MPPLSSCALRSNHWRCLSSRPTFLLPALQLPRHTRTFSLLSRKVPTPHATRRRLLCCAVTAAVAGGAGLIYAPPWVTLTEEVLPPSTRTSGDLLEGDPGIAFKDRSLPDLLRAFLVYRLCGFTSIVEHSPKVLRFLEAIHCSAPFYWITKHTFFRQFCGGETVDDVVGLLKELANSNVGCILDLSIEADVDPTDKSLDDVTRRQRINERADRVTDMFKESIIAGSAQKNNFAAVKVTALGSPALLVSISNFLVAVRRKFQETDSNNDGKINLKEFRAMASSINKDMETTALRTAALDKFFSSADRNGDGEIDYIDLSDAIAFESDVFADLLFDPTSGKPLTSLSQDDIDDMKKLMSRLDRLCDYAREKGTRLMIDAEFSYVQPAIDYAALKVQRKYNSIPTASNPDTGPLVSNTYQLYLVDGLPRLIEDVQRAERGGWIFAAKLVRGAYMVSESRRARELGIPDPIHSSIDATHTAYNAGCDYLLGKIADSMNSGKQYSPVAFMVASHNNESIKRTCREMYRLGIPARNGTVMFGQLLGMQDYMTYTLASKGFGVYKYIPFGPIHDVIPYLLRRATENAKVLSGVTIDREMLLGEIRRRLFGRFLPPSRPAVVDASFVEIKH